MFTFTSIVVCMFAYTLITNHTTVYNWLALNYRKWQNLNVLVSSVPKNSTTARIFWVSSKMIARSLYLQFLQYLNTSVVQIDKNRYVVNYVIQGKLYSMVVTPKRGVCPILQITDEHGNDVTEEVKPYTGPSYSMEHSSDVSPTILGYGKLNITTLNNDYTYNENDSIAVS